MSSKLSRLLNGNYWPIVNPTLTSPLFALMVMEQEAALAAGQLSQADIIERQAETIARLQRREKRADEYKQLTKSKLKEAAARLREYRLKVEALQKEATHAREELQRAQKELKGRIRSRPTRSVAVQTQSLGVDRQTQTLQTSVDCAVQTDEDQLVQSSWPLGEELTQETSAALDAALAFSDSDSEGEKGAPPLDPHVSNEIDKELGSDDEEGDADMAVVATEKKEGSRAMLSLLDPEVASAIDKDLESSSDEETDKSGGERAENVQNVDAVVTSASTANLIDKRVLMSIDDELDDEFAALDSDSETEPQETICPTAEAAEKQDSSSSSSSSIDSDSSDDSSENDSDDGGVDTTTINRPEGVTDERVTIDRPSVAEGAIPDRLVDSEQMAPVKKVPGSPLAGTANADNCAPASPAKETTVVLTTPPQKLSITKSAVATDSDRLEVELPPQSVGDQKPNHTATADNPRKAEENSSCVDVDQANGEKDIVSEPRQVTLSPAKDVANLNRNANAGFTREPNEEVASESLSKSVDALARDQTKHIEPKNSIELATSPPEADPATDQHILPVGSPLNASPTQICSGTTRTASEAVADVDSLPASKKIKLCDDKPEEQGENGEILPQVSEEKIESAGKEQDAVENKTQRKLKKSLIVFKRDIAPNKAEANDNNYARRTLSCLVKHISKFGAGHLDHVMQLCSALSETFQKQEVSLISVVRGALGVFRTPRARRAMSSNEFMGLSWLAHQVLLRMMSKRADAGDGISMEPDSYWSQSVDECLLYLRDLLVDGQTDLGDFLTDTKAQLQVVNKDNSISYDTAFAAEIYGLHTRLCQSTGRLTRSRVLLYDCLRENPNIRGLYFAMVMIELNPAIMVRDFDSRYDERDTTLKETLLQVLVVTASVWAEKEALLLNQSSTSMLCRISDAIQIPELANTSGASVISQEAFVGKLFAKLRGSSELEQRADGVKSHAAPADEVDHFELVKSLELCTAVCGLDLVAQCFRIDRCQALFGSSTIVGKANIMDAVGHIAIAAVSEKCKSNDRNEEYAVSVLDWLCSLLSGEPLDETSSKELFNFQLRCAAVCLELVLKDSSAAGLNARRRAIFTITSWFESISSEQLFDLPGTFLRQLRLAVVAACPHVTPVLVRDDQKL